MDSKIRIGILILSLSLLVFSNIILPSGIYGQERIHTVQKGDTFYSIARTWGIKVEELMKHNGISDPTKLLVGLRLRIPSQAAAVELSTSPKSEASREEMYRVVRGDTLFSIARRVSLTVEEIREANSLPVNYLLREGDILRLPVKVSPQETARIGAQAVASAEAAKINQTAKVDTSVSWPIAARELNYMTGKLSGVVITGTRAEPVKSLTWGTVLSAGPYRGFGRVLIVQVDGGYLYVYGGCESLLVKEGDRVGPGTELGKLGVDAVSNKPQLFFMVYRSNAPIDPAKAPRT